MSMNKTSISWTDYTWNPVTGCSHKSDACKFCYAEAFSLRMGWSKRPWTEQNAAENVVLHPERLHDPRTVKNPSRVFVCSMSDLFHDLVPEYFLDDVFDSLLQANHHTYQLLTKRPDRAVAYFDSTGNRAEYLDKISHLWFGVTGENQPELYKRWAFVNQIPAKVKFISYEPALEPINFRHFNGVSWVIVGCESGARRRKMDTAWAYSARNQCDAIGAAFHMKQMEVNGKVTDDITQFPEPLRRREFPS